MKIFTYETRFYLAIGLLIIASISFIIGTFNGIEQAVTAQLVHDKLSVYCQQVGRDSNLCINLE